MKIIKKDSTLQPFDFRKIIAAVDKSAERVLYKFSASEYDKLEKIIMDKILTMGQENISVDIIHNIVETALDEVNPAVAKSYREFRNYKKEFASMLAKTYNYAQSIMYIGDKENSNMDSAMVSTKRSLIYNYMNKELYQKFFLTAEEKQALKDGYIWCHDMSARRDTINCCLFDICNVLTGGFEMGNIWYNEPKTLDVAFDVIGDIVLSAASQQYGGFTLPEVDKVLAPYAKKTYDLTYNARLEEYISLGVPYDAAAKKADEEALKQVQYEMKQGFQGWEYKFNTVASSRGDYPFITITLGLATDLFGKMATTTCLNVRREGQGKKGKKKPVLFPKIVFLYDENLHGAGKELEDVFNTGILCSAKTMYPDWLSLTGEGYVPEMYKKYGLVVSPMGCRAFLSPWYKRGGMHPADENDEPVFVGRFNIGAISLNLPMILAKSMRECRDFYEVLDYYLNMIRQIHLRTYEYLGNMKASTNPLAYCEGGFLGGHLKPNDKIKPLLTSATASFGITALNELQRLYNGNSLAEDGDFAYEVLKYINEKVNEFKEEDGKLYAIYGTPAESLCSRQVTQFRKIYGIIENVSDRSYVSNSFHCHVSEKITPIQKQDIEKRYFDICNGGKIQYVKYPIDYNIEAVKTLVRRAMRMGFYEGVNLSLAYCDDCGHQELSMDVCPVCGSRNLTKIERMNGYLSYSRVKGETRLNDGKMDEIKERVSM